MLNRLEYDVGRDDLSANRPPTIVTKRFAVVVTRDSIFDLYDVVDQRVPASRHEATPIKITTLNKINFELSTTERRKTRQFSDQTFLPVEHRS